MSLRCPDEEQLVDYMENRLPVETRDKLEKHLASCDLCLSGLAVAQSMMQDSDAFDLDNVPESVTQSAIDLVSGQTTDRFSVAANELKRKLKRMTGKTLDYLNLPVLPQWQFSPVRGSKTAVLEDLVCLKVIFGRMVIHIEIEKTIHDAAHIRVKPTASTPLDKPLRVTLKKKEREIASYLMGDFVLFENMPFDHYSISLFSNGDDLGSYFFEIKDTRHGRKQ